MQTTQHTVEGEAVQPEAKAYVRSRPSMEIRTEHFIMKTNARVISNTRSKPDAQQKFWDKTRPRKDVRAIPDGAFEEEGTEIVSAAMHMELPDFDEDWYRTSV